MLSVTTENRPNPRIASDPETWVERYGDILYRFALPRVNDSATAEELVQETFLAALRTRESFRGQSAESTWMMGILKHKIVDYLRKSSREKSFSDTADGMVDALFKPIGHRKRRPPAWNGDPAQLMENEQFLQALQNCMDGLPAVQRQSFLLRTVDEQPADEVCKELGVTPTNLWVLLHRARLRLRECLEAKGFDRPKVRRNISEPAGGPS